MPLFQKRKIVLALGGGSARGFANIGVLKVLERHFGGRKNMPFDIIVGTSIGSLIGAAYCLGMSVEELEERVLEFTWTKIVDFGLFSTGLIKGDK
ncbi:MAG: patatin-like phospholipase family protein, partial [Candidatus Omnitrophota bacterium]